MKNKVLSLTLCLCVMLSIFSMTIIGANATDVNYDVDAVRIGSKVTVTATLPGDINANGGNLTLVYDNEALQYSMTEKAPVGAFNVNYSQNSLKISFASAHPYIVDTVLFQIVFTVIGDTVNADSFEVTDFKIYNEEGKLISSSSTSSVVVDYSVVSTGWVKDDGGWKYYDENGILATNKWLKDSVGWCYVGADGYCVTNCWKKDSIGWCYLDANGRMTTNKWIKDSVGWCYVGADGYCVTNKWVKDSKGWVYLDNNGRMVTNKWVKDSKGWCYVGADGYAVTNAWKKDSKGWCYLDANGRMVINDWVKDGGKWYYLDSNGYMVTGTKIIDGKTYKFNSSGVWIS